VTADFHSNKAITDGHEPRFGRPAYAKRTDLVKRSFGRDPAAGFLGVTLTKFATECKLYACSV
jgi:hypothetical protein